MGKMIVKIWVGKTCEALGAIKLANQIRTWSADHHTGQRLLVMLHSKALQKTALDHSVQQEKLLALRAATTEEVP